jgi:hypothetical protein
MLLSLLYVALSPHPPPGPGRRRARREVEILVLRHQVKDLKRKAGRPRLRQGDSVVLAAASRILPKDRWS